MASESLLESVAQHESTLMEDLGHARDEARQLIEAAHIAGATLLQETNAQLDGEVAALRRDAAAARDAERITIQDATAAKVEHIRTESASRTSVVCDELIARILPSAD